MELASIGGTHRGCCLSAARTGAGTTGTGPSDTAQGGEPAQIPLTLPIFALNALG